MKSYLLYCIFYMSLLQGIKTDELVLEKVTDSKFSNAEIFKDNILVSYNGGLTKYSYDYNIISETPIDELILNSYSEMYIIDKNTIIVQSSREIYLIENDAIKYKIEYDSYSFFRQVIVINSNSFLVLCVELTTSIISYSLYNTELNTPISTIKSSKGYKHYTCSTSSLSGNIYIVCFILDDTNIYYTIFDSTLNKIKEETKINTPENEISTNYLFSISITDNNIILLLVKNNDYDTFLYKSYLLVFELVQNSGKYTINNVGQNGDFIVYNKIYTGNGVFHFRKIKDGEFVIAFPIDETKKEFYFSLFQYKNNVISVKKNYENIPLSFNYEIQGLKILRINSELIISFYYFNDEEEEEIKEVYLSHMTLKEDITGDNQIDYKSIIIEREIISKIEEMKENMEYNFRSNIMHDNEEYKIIFYNTSKSSQENTISKEGLSNVNLLKCEAILKKIYSIPDEEVLNIIKVDIKRKDTISLQVEYEVYSEGLQLLNLNHCKDEIVRVSIPYNLKNLRKNNFRKLAEEIDLEEKYNLGLKYEYDILDSNSPFYNDICTFFDSEYSTDLTIEDRKEYYYMPQMLCEDTCNYSSYNITNKKVDCDCYVKTEPKYNVFYRNFSNNTVDPSFYNKISNVNFKVFQCLEKGFKNFSKNAGVWIILILFISFCILSVLAIIYENKKYKIEIQSEEEAMEESSFSETKLAVMNYELSLKKDKRKYYQMYLGTIKYNNLISFTFINKEYSKNIYLKILMFIFFIVVLFLFNIFLFLDKSFTRIYLNEGKYNFGNEYPMALAVVFICLLINMGIRLLLKEKEKKIRVFKQINNSTKNNMIGSINNIMNISENSPNKKIIFFSFIGVVVIIIVFFYLVSFGGIFINSQKYLVIRVLLSLVTSFIIPFIFCLIYSLLRYLGLKKQNELLYKISLIVQNY